MNTWPLGQIGARKLWPVLTPHSKATTAIPEAAPLPASPTKCSLPMLLAKRDAPICGKNPLVTVVENDQGQWLQDRGGLSREDFVLEMWLRTNRRKALVVVVPCLKGREGGRERERERVCQKKTYKKNLQLNNLSASCSSTVTRS